MQSEPERDPDHCPRCGKLGWIVATDTNGIPQDTMPCPEGCRPDRPQAAPSTAIALAVRGALLRVADNVAKHTIQRSGWEAGDPCFVVDLTGAEAELLELFARQAAVIDGLGERVRRMGRHLALLAERERRRAEPFMPPVEMQEP